MYQCFLSVFMFCFCVCAYSAVLDPINFIIDQNFLQNTLFCIPQKNNVAQVWNNFNE